MVQKHFELNNKLHMPAVGLGVLSVQNNGALEKAILKAIEHGYRKIDTASAYENEEGVGQALSKSGIQREAMFITTKVWNSEQGYRETLRAFDRSLNRLKTDYIDMYLIHWPVKATYKETYRALEELYADGKCRAIGVCNFGIAHLKDLLANATVVPALNQIEMHPRHSQKNLLAFATEHAIQLEAWRPLMMGAVLQVPELVQLGKKYGKTAAQISLRWLIQRNVAVIPKSVTPQRIAENMALFDFELTAEDMAIINALNKNMALGDDLSEVI